MLGVRTRRWSSIAAERRPRRKMTRPTAPPITKSTAKMPIATAHPLPPLFLLNPGPRRVVEGFARHGPVGGGWPQPPPG
jgi:hypothetical protein